MTKSDDHPQHDILNGIAESIGRETSLIKQGKNLFQYVARPRRGHATHSPIAGTAISDKK